MEIDWKIKALPPGVSTIHVNNLDRLVEITSIELTKDIDEHLCHRYPATLILTSKLGKIGLRKVLLSLLLKMENEEFWR